MEAKLSLEALKASVLPTLDITIPQGTGPTKFKRVRQPAGAASHPSSASLPPASAINTTTTTTTATAAPPALELQKVSAVKADTPANNSVTTAAATMTAATPATTFKKQAPRQYSKPVPDDLQAAAAAIFAPLTPVATPDFSSESAAIVHSTGPKAPGKEPDDHNKKKRRRKGKHNNNSNNNNNQTAEGSVAKDIAAVGVEMSEGTSAPKKQKMIHSGSTATAPTTTAAKKPKSPNTGTTAAKRRANTKRVIKLARSLDSQPELVGLSAAPEDDFDTLLNQHYEHTNKMLQRDIEEETRKAAEQIKKQQRELEALTAQMMLEVEAASNPAPFSGTPATSSQSATKPLDGSTQSGTKGPNSKEKQPFVPRRDCMYYIKGRCFKDKECTFRHDPSAIQIAEPQVQLPKIESEEVRRSRGVCRFHKTGCCTRGDYCRQSHNLKSEPCSFYHLQGQCSRGDECQFGHTPIGPEEHQALVADITAKMKRKAEALAAHQALDAEIASRMSHGSHGTQGLFV
ncbi:hypothetical protein EMPS_05006 [Entomortierella parvispora]|uniref:C3H1-type domain-containing protein n=1 Tax=Entomortierella parvispora TaxID=205924 RepID=A0A9P3HA83_9FUNG|nr:hypothetical protein EMPS_05006 [Entomortierella parvispora]